MTGGPHTFEVVSRQLCNGLSKLKHATVTVVKKPLFQQSIREVILTRLIICTPAVLLRGREVDMVSCL